MEGNQDNSNQEVVHWIDATAAPTEMEVEGTLEDTVESPSPGCNILQINLGDQNPPRSSSRPSSPMATDMSLLLALMWDLAWGMKDYGGINEGWSGQSGQHGSRAWR